MMLEKLITAINNPGSEYRAAPFWAWNSKLEDEELRRQIDVMHDMGMGGFFMHARVGLDTPYMKDEWFRKVGLCIEHAASLGMDAWLYDEDRWPSGTAGGMVTRERKYRIQALVMSENPPPVEEDTVADFGTFAVKNDGNDPTAWKRRETAKDDEKLLHFFVRLSEPESWYNGQSYLNTLDSETVARFIELTHMRYFERFGSDFGKRIKGIFTDEPNFRTAFFSENANAKAKSAVPPRLVPWTSSLPERFKAKYNYDLLEHLPELFYDKDGEEFSKVRLDYYNLVTELFVNSYARQIGEWCEKHNLPLTGHAHWEDSLLLQRHQVGAAMRFYEYLAMPGIDMLTEHWAVYDTVKQCVSVAAQLGKKRRLSECYGCTGWDFPFAGHKAIGDWQYALGINFRCQHLAWYSMAGEAKRDYPASISFQSPWYRQYKVVEEYFARLGAVLSDGSEQREILVLHPIESTWGWKDDARISKEESNREDCRLIDVRTALLKANFDFDYGDEELLSRYASIRGSRFVVGKMDYGVVVLPQLRTIRMTTLQKLAEFRNAGGIVLYIGTPPTFVDGLRNPLAEALFKNFSSVKLEDLAAAIPAEHRLVSIMGNGEEVDPVLSQIRYAEDYRSLFLCNVGHSLDIRSISTRNTAAAACGIEGDQKIEPGILERNAEFPLLSIAWRTNSTIHSSLYELDLETGKFYSVASSISSDGMRHFTTSLDRLGSRLFIETAEAVSCSERPDMPKHLQRMALPATAWDYHCDEENVFVLDHADIVAEGLQMQNEFILSVDAAVRDHLKIPRRGGAMLQPYLVTERQAKLHYSVTLTYRFNVETLPASGIQLAMEHPEAYQFSLNGESFAFADGGYWVDPVLRRGLLPAKLLKTGENCLRLTTLYHEYHPGFEAIFLLGQFGVCNDIIGSLPAKLDIGDITGQGFPYYSGNITLQTTLQLQKGQDKHWLEIPAWRGVALGVSINGSQQKIVPWPPYRLEIGQWLHIGENTIAVTVFGHRRNAFGPFYLNEASPSWVGPAQFKEVQQPKRQLVPLGLLSSPEITD